MITINIICDHGIFRQVLMALRNDSDKSFFPSQNFVKPMQFYCFQFLVTNRQEPSHVGISPKTSEMCQPTRGGHDGGGGITISCSIIFLYKCSSSAKFIWFGLVVWFFVFTRFYKNNNTFRQLDSALTVS